MPNYSYIDIFAGCGGLSLGLQRAGWKGVFAIEKSCDAFQTLFYNMVENKKHFTWVKWLPKKEHDINDIICNYYNQLKNLSGKITLVVGGPPCQGFSSAGKRDKDDHRNTLSTAYINFIRIIRPQILLFENVHGFTVGFSEKDNAKGVPYSDIVKEKLESLGYNVASEIIDMSEYGIPQKRKRLILIGCLNNDPKLFFNILKKNNDVFLSSRGLNKHCTVYEAISDLQKDNGMVNTPDCKNYQSGIYGTMKSSYQKYLRGVLLKGINSVNSHRFTKHSKEIIELNNRMLSTCIRLKKYSRKEDIIYGLKKRGLVILDANQPAPTVTSHPDDFLHYCEPRILTVREMARIQSFPDEFEFKGRYTTGGKRRKLEVPRYTQVGNAIPPIFAEQAGLALMELISNGND